MLLRVFLFTLLCYQAVNAVKNRGSTTKNAAKDKYVTIEDEPQEMNIESIELDGKNPPMIYFWSTVRGVMNAFIHAWNAVDSDHSRPRETAQNIWYALEKTITHPIGSVSLMRISDHFADTMTHVTAEKTLDDLFTAIHLVVLRNNFDFMRAEYKLFTEGKAGKNIKEILKAVWDEWELLHSPKMTESLETIKKWITSVFPEELSEFVEQDEPTLKRENSREESKLESPSFQRQDSGKKSKLRRKPTLERKNSSTNVNTKRELKRVKSKKGD